MVTIVNDLKAAVSRCVVVGVLEKVLTVFCRVGC